MVKFDLILLKLYLYINYIGILNRLNSRFDARVHADSVEVNKKLLSKLIQDQSWSKIQKDSRIRQIKSKWSSQRPPASVSISNATSVGVKKYC